MVHKDLPGTTFDARRLHKTVLQEVKILKIFKTLSEICADDNICTPRARVQSGEREHQFLCPCPSVLVCACASMLVWFITSVRICV